MRDLSIRGAGNLLGAQQHGFIDSVGFDMYSQMLSEAVARKQGKKYPRPKKRLLKLIWALMLIFQERTLQTNDKKIEIYKRIRQLEKYGYVRRIRSGLVRPLWRVS